jgi:hypothetical protein
MRWPWRVLPAAATLAWLTAAACGESSETGPSEPATCDVVACKDAANADEAMTAHEVEQYRLALDAWATRAGDACRDVAAGLGREAPADVGEPVGRASTLCAAAGGALVEAGISLGEPEDYGFSWPRVFRDRFSACVEACPCEACGDVEQACPQQGGRCPGTCEHACASIEGPADCDGHCNGRCQGTCSAPSTADGVCQDTCTGPCVGICEVGEGQGSCDGLCLGACDQPFVDCVTEAPGLEGGLGCVLCRSICDQVALMDARYVGVAVPQLQGRDAATMAAVDRLVAARAEWATWSGEPSLLDDLSARFPETPTYGGDGRRCLEEARPAAEALFADLHTVEETMTAF